MSLKYEKDLVYAAVAHDRDVEGEDVETTRLVGGYTFGPARVMLLYQFTDPAKWTRRIRRSVAWTFGKTSRRCNT